jgi:hypothetical protein
MSENDWELKETVVQNGYWAAIRETDGRRWIDMSTISNGYPEVQEKIREVNAGCGEAWAKVNPAKWIGPIVISTVGEGNPV